MGRVSAVLFDMDGVLVDSEAIMLQSAKSALREWGVAAKDEDFTEFVGSGEDKYVGGVAEKHGVPYVFDMKRRAYEIYGELAAVTPIAYPGAADMLRRLRERGLPLALCSSADRVKVEINIRSLGLSPADFACLMTGESVALKKPHPDIYLAAAGALGLPPAECVVVEDAVNGIRAARAAGMRVVAVTTSFTREELLTQAPPDRIAEGFADIIAFVTAAE